MAAHLSGKHDFLLQVSLCNAFEYEAFPDQKLCWLPMVEKVNISVVLKEYKIEPAMPAFLIAGPVIKA
ncbi:MAG TPA: Lrp/AsnC ligand binding domain-containing protein [Mucilaginibacter sp.]